MTTLLFESEMAVSAKDLWEWHERPKALERMIPPWENIEILVRDRGFEKENLLRVKVGPFRKEWLLRFVEWVPNESFTDIQVRGPFREWSHFHQFIDREGGSFLRDTIYYKLPLGPVGKLGAGEYMERRLKKSIHWRHNRISRDLKYHAKFKKRLTIVVSGASGLVGKEFCELMQSGEHEIIQLVRRPALESFEMSWDPFRATVDDFSRIENTDGWVHLGGANLADKLWDADYKKKIIDSRVLSTKGVKEILAKLESPPKVWVNASAIGFYGADGEFDETSSGGDDFLAKVCKAWEQEASNGLREDVRLVLPRIGVVMSSKGGALAKLIPLFKTGLGGPVGLGKRKMSWIDLEDLTHVLGWCLINEEVSGPFNAVSPNSVSSKEFAKSIGNNLRRPKNMPTPSGALRFALGEMAEATILSSSQVHPMRLLEYEFDYEFATLDECLKNQLG